MKRILIGLLSRSQHKEGKPKQNMVVLLSGRNRQEARKAEAPGNLQVRVQVYLILLRFTALFR